VQDRVVTNDFPIVGRIVSPTIKAQSQYLGVLELKLSELRSISWMGGSTEVEVLVDATKYCHRTNWLDTGFTVEQGVALQLIASGEVDLLPGNGGGEFISGPQGNPGIGGPRMVKGMPGSLLGKIGESGAVFVVGERYSTIPATEGKLFLQIV